MFLFGPEGTELPVFDVFGSLSSYHIWLILDVLLLITDIHSSTKFQSTMPFPSVILGMSSKLCTVGLGTGTFPEVTLFDAVCFFWELLPRCDVLILKGLLFALKSDFLSIEATCLLICGALLSHRILTNPNQYDATWLMSILGTSSVHHIESNRMILLGDLVLDIYQSGAHTMSNLHHCRIQTCCECCLRHLLFGRPFLHRWGNKILNLCNSIQLGCAPGLTLTSVNMVPGFPGTLIVISVIISDLLSGSVSVYSLSTGLLLVLVLWAILLLTA